MTSALIGHVVGSFPRPKRAKRINSFTLSAAVGLSANGSTLYAMVANRWLYKTTDRGVSWVIVKDWLTGTSQSHAASEDLIKILHSAPSAATRPTPTPDYSSDGGVTWNALTITGLPASRSITQVAMDRTGTKWGMAVTNLSLATNHLYYSIDGVNWTLIRSSSGAVSFTWISTDGTKILIADTGLYYHSTNSGATWTGRFTTFTSPSIVWADSTATIFLLVDLSSTLFLYKSTDSGATSSLVNNSVALNVGKFSSDGLCGLFFDTAQSTLYITYDGGLTWDESFPAPYTAMSVWFVSRDKSTMIINKGTTAGAGQHLIE